MDNDTAYKVLQKQINWENLFFYRKSDVLYQMTVVFCRRFLPLCGDRTVDQMVQAARSGKQNIVEGLADGLTSSEMQLKLLNVARASLQELREDYIDYLKAHSLPRWTRQNERYEGMMSFCREHNDLADYETFFEQWSAEEMCNIALTLCHMTDRMMSKFLEGLEHHFVKEGGIKERMHAARTGYRQEQAADLERLRQENVLLRQENDRLRQLLLQHGIKF